MLKVRLHDATKRMRYATCDKIALVNGLKAETISEENKFVSNEKLDKITMIVDSSAYTKPPNVPF